MFEVTHDDRQLEFFIMQKKVHEAISTWAGSSITLNWSCEQWARMIMEATNAFQVEVSEDNENGAIVCSG